MLKYPVSYNERMVHFTSIALQELIRRETGNVSAVDISDKALRIASHIEKELR